jgi:predicted phage terminase large subunit-like protein
MPSAANMYADLMRHDLCSFIHRSFLELNPQTPFLPNWHIEVLAAKLEEVRLGTCKRLIINLPPRHLKSHTTSIAFPAWLLGQEPSKQILCVSYARNLSEKLARESRNLMMSPFYQGLFDTRISDQRDAASEFETTDGGFRLSTSVGGVLTGRGADIIIVDDPLKADDALSKARRDSVNAWYDNTLRSRLNRHQNGAIVIVMQRLHANDLVAHVQQNEIWDVLSFAAIAERDEIYEISTPFGSRRIRRQNDDILQSALMNRAALDTQRRSTEYNFASQYQQDPQPAAGIIVKREWLRFYAPVEKPERFDQILQSWDTANKTSELSNFSVCTTWGIKDQHLYLLDVFRKKMDFPDLKRTVQDLARLHHANIVLVEEKASGISLIQQLHNDGFLIVQAAPDLNGAKTMRLRSQTPKIAGGFVLFPTQAPWLDTYLLELVTFPGSNYDDQVDSTVYALAWSNDYNSADPHIQHARAENTRRDPNRMVRLSVPPGVSSTWTFSGGRTINVPDSRIVEVTQEEAKSMYPYGCQPID